MALVVEDGTGTLVAESYISVDDCKSYLDARGKTAFGLANTEQQEVALRVATDYIDTVYGSKMTGYRLRDGQALSFPRYAVMVDDVVLPASPLPRALLNATCEAAHLALTTDLSAALDPAGRVIEKEEVVGPIREKTKWADRAPNVAATYPSIDRWMRALLGISSLVGNVYRG